jgi:hypothetical protein
LTAAIIVAMSPPVIAHTWVTLIPLKGSITARQQCSLSIVTGMFGHRFDVHISHKFGIAILICGCQHVAFTYYVGNPWYRGICLPLPFPAKGVHSASVPV